MGGSGMTDGAVQAWWKTMADEPAKRLARAIAARCGAAPDLIVLPYEPQRIVTPGGVAVAVPEQALVPLWVLYLATAREALAASATPEAGDLTGAPSGDGDTIGAASAPAFEPAGVPASSAGWYEQRGLIGG